MGLKYFRIISVVVALYLFPIQSVFSQDKIELGWMLGAASYMGDLNPTNPFYKPNLSGAMIGRYVFTDRLVFKGTVLLTSLRGGYPASGVYMPHSSGGLYLPETTQQYSFYRPLVGDVSAQLEINFKSFDHQFIRNTKFTPYIAIGLGTTIYKRFVEEGTKPVEKPVFVLSLPLSLGIKYKVNDYVRVGLEWSFRKVFANDLDQTDSQAAVTASDPYGFNQKSLLINTDWISNLGASVTFNMLKRHIGCNAGYKELK